MSESSPCVMGRVLFLAELQCTCGEREREHGAGKKEDQSGLRVEELGTGREQQGASEESRAAVLGI